LSYIRYIFIFAVVGINTAMLCAVFVRLFKYVLFVVERLFFLFFGFSLVKRVEIKRGNPRG